MVLKGESYPLRRLAALFSQQSETVRDHMRRIKQNTAALQQGPDGWKGQGAQAYERIVEVLHQDLDRWVTTWQQTSSTLYLLGDWLDSLAGQRRQLDHLRLELVSAYDPHDHRAYQYHALQRQIDDLARRIQHDEMEFDQRASQQFQQIQGLIPAFGQVMKGIQQIANTQLFTAGHAPKLMFANPGSKQGRERLDALNDTIRMNQSVYDYYDSHPDAVGPNGESAAEMKRQAHLLQEEARRQGGTVGVPIVFMHGLWGGEDTFKNMVDRFGGASMVYTWKRSGKIDSDDGNNQSKDQPIVQFLFKKGSMPFDMQSQAFGELAQEVKQKYNTNYMIVVGHSMGGIVATKYIEDTGGKDVTTLITLASPIGGSQPDAAVSTSASIMSFFTRLGGVYKLITRDVFPAVSQLESTSPQIRELDKNRDAFNKETHVFSAGGNAYGKYLGDSVVLPDSAFKLQDMAGTDMFTCKMYPELDHSGLHEDLNVIEDVYQYINNWGLKTNAGH